MNNVKENLPNYPPQAKLVIMFCFHSHPVITHLVFFSEKDF